MNNKHKVHVGTEKHRDVKSTDGARQKYQHYIALAKSQAAIGDDIAAENYFQHAEHYLRAMHG